MARPAARMTLRMCSQSSPARQGSNRARVTSVGLGPCGLGRGYSAGAVNVGGVSSRGRTGSEPGTRDPRRTSACSRRCSSACSSASRRSAWNRSSADRRLCTWLRTGASRVSTTWSPGDSPGVFVSSRCKASSVTRPNGPGMYPGPDCDRSGLGSSSKKSGSPVNGTTRTDARVSIHGARCRPRSRVAPTAPPRDVRPVG